MNYCEKSSISKNHSLKKWSQINYESSLQIFQIWNLCREFHSKALHLRKDSDDLQKLCISPFADIQHVN